MKKLYCLVSFILMTFTASSQNLLANSGFEERNRCSEANDICNPACWFRIPSDEIPKPREDAASGNYAEKLVMENILAPVNYRSFIFTRLLCPLQKDTLYQLSIFIRSLNGGFDHLDLWMPANEPYETAKNLRDIKIQYSIKAGNKVSNQPNNWKQYVLEFKASGNEQFLMLGNFNLQAMKTKDYHPATKEVIYEIDSLSLLPVHSCKPCSTYDLNLKELYHIYSRHSKLFFSNWGKKDSVAEKTAPAITIQHHSFQDTIILPDVLFETNSSRIHPSFQYKLDSLAEQLAAKELIAIRVNGHTDSTGTAAYNLYLSQKRAEAVQERLLQKAPSLMDLIQAQGLGDTKPRSSNSSPEGRLLNRRVEIVVFYKNED